MSFLLHRNKKLGPFSRNLRSDIDVLVNKSPVHVPNRSHATTVFINLFSATCFGINWQASSGLL